MNIDYEIAKIPIQQVCPALRIYKLLPSLQLLDLSIRHDASPLGEHLSVGPSRICTRSLDEIRMSFTARFNGDFVRGFIGSQNRNLYDIDVFILVISLHNGEGRVRDLQ